jgi:hypothetical protein
MSWTYEGDPRKNVRDAVRWEVQDTNEKAQQLQDQEILYAIEQEAGAVPPSQGEVLSAAARCMEAISRKWAAQADTELGSLKVDSTKRSKEYAARAKELRNRAVGLHAPFAGGQSENEKEKRRTESDRVQPRFQRGQFHSPYTGRALEPASSGLPFPGQSGQE